MWHFTRKYRNHGVKAFVVNEIQLAFLRTSLLQFREAMQNNASRFVNHFRTLLSLAKVHDLPDAV